MTSNVLKQQNNPVLQSEFRYQRFVIQRSRNGNFWIFLAVLLVAPSILISIGYSVGRLLNLFPVVNWYSIPQTWHLNLLLMLVVVNISLYIVVTLVTLALSNSSISREKAKHTWSLLRLTNVKDSQIVVGKWWASVWALNGDHTMVIILRVGLLAAYLAIFLPSQHALDDITAPYRLYFLVMLPLIVLQGALDAALTAILGVVGAIPNETWQTVASFATMIIRLFLSIGLAWWFWNVLGLMHDSFTDALNLAGAGILGTIVALVASLLIARLLVERT